MDPFILSQTDDYCVRCDDPHDIVSKVNKIMPLLPKEKWHTFSVRKLTLLQQLGIEGLHRYCNGRMASDIVNEFLSADGGEPIEQGEVDGVTYSLHEHPKADD